MIINKPKKALSVQLSLGGSKSFTNRALIIAALAKGESVIENASVSNDTKLLLCALKKLGYKIKENKDKTKIKIAGGIALNKKVTLNAHDAGTTYRFLTALCALAGKEIVLTGNERMQERPVGELVRALNTLGAEISYIKKDGCPPLKIKKGNLSGGVIKMDGSVSSQFISAVLMLGPVLKKGLTVNISGKMVSSSYIDMTLSVMKDFGANVENKNYKKIIVRPGGYKPGKYSAECDISGASYFWAIGALSEGGKVRVKGVNVNSVQGDIAFVDALAKMGASVTKNPKRRFIEVRSTGSLKALKKIDMTKMPDAAQTLAVVCAFAKGQSKLTGLSTLKVKETDRIEALKKELSKMGVKTKTGKDFIFIDGAENPKKAKIKTYKDHRMAMSFACAAAKIDAMEIENPEVVKKSFPDFWQKLSAAGFKLKK